MLAEIRIDSLGVISEASAQFHEGLTVLTGETGAGKTMVVTSLHLLSGARADAGRVRLGASRAVVEGRFIADDVSPATEREIVRILESSGAERDEDGTIIAVRTVGSDGRSRAHLGGRSVPAGVLSEFTDPLLTVHGQNDQLRLLRPDQQRNALDRFGDKAIGTLLTRYRKHRREWLDARSELIERTSKARELAQEADQLTFALNEIDGVAPEPGEDTAIVAEVRRLSELDSLRSAAEEAHAALAGNDDMASGDVGVMPALDLMSEARARIESVTDADLDGLGSRLADAIAVVTDVAGDLNTYLSGLPVSSDALSLLAKQVEETAGLTAEAATKLSAARVKAAAKLAKAVSAELAGLAMGRAGLEVTVRSQPAGPQDSAPLSVGGVDLHAGSAGVDEVEFRLSAHSGAPSLPISKSASGGELSRVMLALEVVLAGSDTGATMVFDEVDAGVGGRAAVEIGRRLAKLARTHQVIVVTHLPQVAAFADTHLVVDKVDDKGGVVSSGVRTLSDSDRVVELARMLAGLDDTETGRAHAEELLEIANAARVTD
ncbi:MAG: repair protein RecN [Rhodococcus erythropolis]|nr:DNA repair protein RecN [Rhodococcus erythropolis]MDF2899266.1 repair protein RecN [Rhodococcus erythropolis]